VCNVYDVYDALIPHATIEYQDSALKSFIPDLSLVNKSIALINVAKINKNNFAHVDSLTTRVRAGRPGFNSHHW
jgi:hypothetical protein